MNLPDKQPTGHGFLVPILDVERDYVFGGTVTQLKGEIINESGDWTPYLPSGEFQAPRFETNACTCFGTSNALETLINYIFGEQENFSDRFIAKGAGVDPARGAVPKAAADFIRKNWSVKETSWPMEGVETVDDYYKPLPPILFTEAKQDKGDYTFAYEWVNPSLSNLREALKRGTVCMSVSLWLGDDGKYYRPEGWSDSHWIQLVRIFENGDMLVFDSYAPFLKTVRAGFLPQVAYRYAVNEKEVDKVFFDLRKILAALTKWLEQFGQTIKGVFSYGQ